MFGVMVKNQTLEVTIRPVHHRAPLIGYQACDARLVFVGGMEATL